MKNPFIDVEPDDLLRYGLIPELVGRLPVAVPLDSLDEDALIRILIEPKNALSKQYQKLFELEDVRLTRSEEHTSELQSPCNLVCRLLLEKKKKKKIIRDVDTRERA